MLRPLPFNEANLLKRLIEGESVSLATLRLQRAMQALIDKGFAAHVDQSHRKQYVTPNGRQAYIDHLNLRLQKETEPYMQKIIRGLLSKAGAHVDG